VKYDLQRKLWIYLHKNRSLDFPAWNEHLKKADAGNPTKVPLNAELELKEDSIIETESLNLESITNNINNKNNILNTLIGNLVYLLIFILL
jgi:hypothetical protein